MGAVNGSVDPVRKSSYPLRSAALCKAVHSVPRQHHKYMVLEYLPAGVG